MKETQMTQNKKVQVVVLRDTGQSPDLLLLQTRSKRGGFWQNVTGSVEDGESFDQAARRELEEETGLKPINLFPLNLEFHFQDRFDRQIHEKVFAAIVRSDSHVTISDEHQVFLWKEIKTISEKNFKYPSNYQAFEEAIELYAGMPKGGQ